MTEENPTKTNFIREIIDEHNRTGRFGGRVHTRFPPEPNGYLHIGHAKALCIDFGIAEDYGGITNLRYDDTNPVKEDVEYVDAIKEDIRWLGFDWGDREFYASDYFEPLYEMALQLIRKGLAYVDELSQDEMREYRGTLTEPGKNSPWRDRPIEENLDLFKRMRAGEFPDGSKTLRAKIDMASPNINMRDPVMYRILHATHHRTGDTWCIYPMYDFAHGQSDSLEGITHSMCSLEYENHRPLYDWFLDQLDIFHPQQIEFARLNLTHTVMSKRKLRRLVENGLVDGWTDPRMPTLAAMRRRGYPAAAIREFIDTIGVAKSDSFVEVELLEHIVRDQLNQTAKRRMAVLQPLKVVLTNYPEEQVEYFEVPDFPQDPEAGGSRKVPFGRELWIERDDFAEVPPPKYHRLSPGKEVRLMNAYFVTCADVVKDQDGNVIEIHCTYDPETRGGSAPDGRKVKGTIHWVSAAHAIEAEVRIYDQMFLDEYPEDLPEGETFLDNFNHDSLQVVSACLEPDLANAQVGEAYQFVRDGYFALDNVHTQAGKLVFNRTIGLVDSWAKIHK
ncbi:MAG: glutamine--tRNA ligase/YqeY domain fusion protein [Chloroflexota bacterium]|jgi:glutaminyl-tRNA synthetase|nr:glutamine--tRNA ligase/YqeY domain fusion protein [Chloroflexota bacterium]